MVSFGDTIRETNWCTQFSVFRFNERMESTNSFGYWIRRQRKTLDLTQPALADIAGARVANSTRDICAHSWIVNWR